MTEWQLQDAKNRFSAVVDAGKAAAPTFVEMLLAIPKDGEEFERLPLRLREFDF